MKTKTRPGRLVRALCTLLLFLAFFCFFSARWFVSVYGRLGFDSILFTLTSSLGGVQSGLISDYLLRAMVPCVGCTLILSVLLVSQPWRSGRHSRGKRRKGLPLVIPVLLSLGLIVFAAFDVELVDYLLHQSANSGLYETYYQDPETVNISAPKEKRNLVYIMLESMETSYLSRDLGGAMEENLIPELYDLAAENVCFSHDDREVGGYHCTSGATWTIGSMVAQTAGIPLKTPTEDVNQYGSSGEAFLPGVTTLMDILDREGYNQSLMVGSYVVFGGRKAYYTQHGVENIYDVYSAQDDGIIPSDYFVWWGMEDLYLFEYAKEELTRLAALDEPFAFTTLTVDTHHVGGYQCALCQESASGEPYDQSISCSSRQVAEFVAWLQAQDFYENTTVVIVGDHESMDNGYFERMTEEDYPRMIYNCFLNSAVNPKNVTNRQFTAHDLFPTTLSAMGFRIPGDRLGLGTDLFSGTKTLAEIMGIETYDTELAKASDYYKDNFWN